MKKQMILFGGLLLCQAIWAAAADIYVPVSESGEIPVISYYVDRYIPSQGLYNYRTSVIFSMWNNGTVVWSKNELGGAPYYRLKLSPAEAASVLRYFEDHGWFKPPISHTQYASAQDPTPTLWLLNGSRYIHMKNSHVLWEKDYKDVKGTSKGIRSLRTDDPNSIEALRTPDYMKFRKTWDEMVAYLLARMPLQGKEADIAFQPKKVILQK